MCDGKKPCLTDGVTVNEKGHTGNHVCTQGETEETNDVLKFMKIHDLFAVNVNFRKRQPQATCLHTTHGSDPWLVLLGQLPPVDVAVTSLLASASYEMTKMVRAVSA